MTLSQRRGGLALALVAAILIAYFLTAAEGAKVRRRQFRGQITRLDPVAGTGTLRIVHPASGQEIDVSGVIDPACRVVIDGRIATTADLRVGDEVIVDVLRDRRRSFHALAMTVARHAGRPPSPPVASPTAPAL